MAMITLHFHNCACSTDSMTTEGKRNSCFSLFSKLNHSLLSVFQYNLPMPCELVICKAFSIECWLKNVSRETYSFLQVKLWCL